MKTNEGVYKCGCSWWHKKKNNCKCKGVALTDDAAERLDDEYYLRQQSKRESYKAFSGIDPMSAGAQSIKQHGAVAAISAANETKDVVHAGWQNVGWGQRTLTEYATSDAALIQEGETTGLMDGDKFVTPYHTRKDESI